MSALASTRSLSGRSSESSVRPMLQVSLRAPPGIEKGLESAACTLAAIIAASLASSRSAATTRSRPGRSGRRSRRPAAPSGCAAPRAATTSSQARWPSASRRILNRSRSTRSTAVWVAARSVPAAQLRQVGMEIGAVRHAGERVVQQAEAVLPVLLGGPRHPGVDPLPRRPYHPEDQHHPGEELHDQRSGEHPAAPGARASSAARRACSAMSSSCGRMRLSKRT